MTTHNDLIRAIINKKIQEEMQTKQLENSGNPLDRINGISSKVGNFGEGLSETGKFLSNYDSLNKIGTGMQTAGNALQTGANAVQSAIPSSSALMDNIGSKIASSLPSAIGGTATSAGVGAAAGTGAATTAGTTAASTAGASAAGAGAAGGSAASGAAAAGPIGALVALGMMALQGTNRKRAKKSGEQAQQLADTQVDIAKDRLNQSSMIANELGNQYMPLNLEQTQTDNDLTKYGGDTKDLIDSYIQSAIPEQSPITNAINSYMDNPSEPVDNSNQIQNKEQETKKGIFNNLANGLNDLITGYKDNREHGFNADNLRPDSNKGAMQRIGEGIGTAARLVQNPVTQGVVAGGLSTALTGNPLYGLGMGYKFYNQKNNSDLYKDILAKQGIDTGSSSGILSSDDLAKILIAKRYQKDFMTRKDYDRMRLENGQISIDEYNSNLSNPDYKPDEMVNINGLNSVARAGRYEQENKNDKSKNYYRSQNDGKNVIKVEYGEKPDSHSYTHVTYGPKPESKSTTYVQYGQKPPSGNGSKTNNNNNGKGRIKVKSPDGKVGTIPVEQLADAIKKGYKKL